MRIVCFELGSFSIKVMEADVKSRNIEIVSFRSVEVEKGAGETRDRMFGSLKKYVSDNNIRGDKTVVIVPSSWVSNKVLTLPFKDRKALSQAIQYEIEDYIPYRVEDIVMDFQVLGHEGNASRVVASIVPKFHYERLVATLNDCGISPDVIMPDIISLFSFVQYGSDDRSGYAVIELGHDATRIVIFKNGEPVAIRTITYGGSDVIEEISRKFDVKKDLAAKMLHELGKIGNDELASLPDDDEKKALLEHVKTAFSPVLVDVNQTFLGASSADRSVVDNIYICGGLTQIEVMKGAIEEEFKVPVKPFDAYSKVSTEGIPYADEILPHVPSMLGGVVRYSDRKLSQGIINFQKVVITPEAVTKEINTLISSPGVAYFAKLGLVLLGIMLVHFVVGKFMVSSMTDAASRDFRNYIGKVFPHLTYVQKRQVMSDADSLKGYLRKKIREQERQLAMAGGTDRFSALRILRNLSEIRMSSKYKFNLYKFAMNDGKVELRLVMENFYGLDSMKKTFKDILDYDDFSLARGKEKNAINVRFKL